MGLLTNKLIKLIDCEHYVYSCKFTDDSAFLYVGSSKIIYQYDVNNQFKEMYKYNIHDGYIFNIYCLSSTIILT